MKHVTCKYGVEILHTVKGAYDLDKKNGNTLWQDSLVKEMTNLCVSLDILDRGVNPPPGYINASGYIFFDVYMILVSTVVCTYHLAISQPFGGIFASFAAL